MNRHAEKVLEGVGYLYQWFKTGEPSLGVKVRNCEHEADEIRVEIARELGEIFVTPIDREDIYLITGSVDQIINYAKNTVRELEIFNIPPDEYMLDLSELLVEGTENIRDGIAALPKMTMSMSDKIERAVKAERNVEKVYRRAVNALFEGEDMKEILKRREVYRHLSNTADRILETADLLSMILMKYG